MINCSGNKFDSSQLAGRWEGISDLGIFHFMIDSSGHNVSSYLYFEDCQNEEKRNFGFLEPSYFPKGIRIKNSGFGFGHLNKSYPYFKGEFNKSEKIFHVKWICKNGCCNEEFNAKRIVKSPTDSINNNKAVPRKTANYFKPDTLSLNIVQSFPGLPDKKPESVYEYLSNTLTDMGICITDKSGNEKTQLEIVLTGKAISAHYSLGRYQRYTGASCVGVFILNKPGKKPYKFRIEEIVEPSPSIIIESNDKSNPDPSTAPFWQVFENTVRKGAIKIWGPSFLFHRIVIQKIPFSELELNDLEKLGKVTEEYLIDIINDSSKPLYHRTYALACFNRFKYDNRAIIKTLVDARVNAIKYREKQSSFTQEAGKARRRFSDPELILNEFFELLNQESYSDRNRIVEIIGEEVADKEINNELKKKIIDQLIDIASNENYLWYRRSIFRAINKIDGMSQSMKYWEALLKNKKDTF